MDIALELQQEAIYRAGSPEGFQQVIRLVLDNMEGEVLPLPTSSAIPVFARPEWLWPEVYIHIFHEYVNLRQEILWCRKRLQVSRDRSEINSVQQQLERLISDVHTRRNELPVHARKRLLAIEARYKEYHQGDEDLMYHPSRWEAIGGAVESHLLIGVRHGWRGRSGIRYAGGEEVS